MASSKKSKTKSKTGRGGKRPGAGRPVEQRGPGGISWTLVRRYARLGSDRETIVVALAFTPEQLRNPDVIARLQQEMDRGAAQHKLDLLADISSLRKGGDGSVNATLASLREKWGWDRPDSAKTRERSRPDNEAAVAELERILRRARAPR